VLEPEAPILFSSNIPRPLQTGIGVVLNLQAGLKLPKPNRSYDGGDLYVFYSIFRDISLKSYSEYIA
jgi:hypothetical protein